MQTRFLVTLFILMSVLDTVFTLKIIKYGHDNNDFVYETTNVNTERSMTKYEKDSIYFKSEDYEDNPLAKYVIKKTGIDGVIVYKLIFVSLFCVCVHFIYKKYPYIGKGLAGFAMIATAFVAFYGLLFLILTLMV